MALPAPRYAVITVDDRGRIIETSAGADALLGFDRATAAGREIAGLVGADLAAIASGRELPTTITRPDGTSVPVQASFHRLASLGVLTVREVDREELERSREYAEAIIAAMGEGYALTVDGRLESVNDALCALTGFTREQLTGAGMPFPFWPPENLAQSWAIRDRVVKAGGGTFEMTLQRADGTLFDAEITAKPAYRADGTMLGFVNTMRDISERRRHEEEQQALREIAELVADAASEAVVFSAAAKHVRDLFGAYGGAVAQFDGAAGVARLRSVWSQTEGIPPSGAYPLDGDGLLAAVSQSGRCARRDELRPPAELQLSAAAIGAVAAPVVVKGRVWGAVVASFAGGPPPEGAEERLERFADLVALAVANTEAWDTLAREAATDSVTGLANHRSFHDRLRGEVQRAKRYGRSVSLVLLDLDHFKRVNDTYGHPAGDQVLAAFARLLNAQARQGELVARIGGEEFAWLMPEADRHAAYRAAERIRRRIELEEFPYAGRITVSAGVATSDGGEFSADELIRHADRALYWAKDGGRNATFLYSEEAHELLSDRLTTHAAHSQAMASVRALAHAIDSKDPGTRRHSERVATIAQRLALSLGWTTKRAQLLHDCGLLHDIGKIGIPDEILFKPGPLTRAEHAQLRRHAEVSALIASEVLEHEQVMWIRGHHERWDGSGYPDRLAGEQISDGAQLLAVADAYDAMTEVRTYEEPKSAAEALAECRAQAGTQFAPVAVAALVAISLPGSDDGAGPPSVGFGPSWAGGREHTGRR